MAGVPKVGASTAIATRGRSADGFGRARTGFAAATGVCVDPSAPGASTGGESGAGVCAVSGASAATGGAAGVGGAVAGGAGGAGDGAAGGAAAAGAGAGAGAGCGDGAGGATGAGGGLMGAPRGGSKESGST
ncbi:MAG TPA: hypothetical protein VHI12_08295 [Gaiellaceae bacterium]|nr:hypothetical protein [Gaiellaceae bacterium]